MNFLLLPGPVLSALTRLTRVSECDPNFRWSKEEDSGVRPGRDVDPLSPRRGLKTHSETGHAARLHPQSKTPTPTPHTVTHTHLS